MPEIRVVHQDGTEHVLPHVEDEVEERFDKLWNATLVTTRDAARDVAFDEADDYVYLESEDDSRDFGGVLRDVDVGEEEADLVVDSFERLAIDAEPTDSGTRWQGVTDRQVILDAIDAVPDLSAGDVQHLKSGLSFLFSHATQAKRIRTVMDASGGRIRYNADRTVDHTARLGSDRDAILAPSNRRVVASISVDRKGGEDKATHLRMLGAGEGRHQKSAVVVDPEYDPAVDREKWRVYSNKDFTDEDTLREHGRELIAEFAEEWVEVQTTLRNIDPPLLGDTFPVEHPESGLDRRLKVVRIVRKRDADGRRWDVDLSSRQLTREHAGQKARSDVERFNKSVQGTAVPINASGGRQPVNATNTYEMRLYYPSEVEYEHRLNVRVVGLPYRAYSAGGASGGDHTHSVDVTHPQHDHSVSVTHPSHRHSISTTSASNDAFTTTVHHSGSASSATSGGSWVAFDSASISNATAEVYNLAAFYVQNLSGTTTLSVRIESGGSYYPSSNGVAVNVINSNVPTAVVVIAPDNLNGQTATLEIETSYSDTVYGISNWYASGPHTHGVSDTSTAELGTTETATSSAELGTTSTETSGASGPHTHDPEPGIIESFGTTTHYPENCDVLVNGTSQGTAFGDGTGRFEESVEVLGELTPGAMNRIEVTSGSLGHLMVYLEGDCYRQIIGGG